MKSCTQPGRDAALQSLQSQQADERQSRSFAAVVTIAVCAAILFAGFAALGTWQLERLEWKQDLISRVEQRIHAEPVEAPASEKWPQISREQHEYRRVRVTGTFLHEHTIKVQAATQLGSGHWLLTPLRRQDGSLVLINRGFVPLQSRHNRQLGTEAHAHGADIAVDGTNTANEVSVVTGLLRISEPDGAFLRNNDPGNNRWYSRDVKAITQALGLEQVAPYFIDAGKDMAVVRRNPSANENYSPIPGLTVVSFPNNHLVYAFTWYVLALMVGMAAVWTLREDLKMLRDKRIAFADPVWERT